jgi:hypothetical protein
MGDEVECVGVSLAARIVSSLDSRRFLCVAQVRSGRRCGAAHPLWLSLSLSDL